MRKADRIRTLIVGGLAAPLAVIGVALLGGLLRAYEEGIIPFSHLYGAIAMIGSSVLLILVCVIGGNRDFERANNSKSQRSRDDLLKEVEVAREIAKKWDGMVIVVTEPLERGPFGDHLHIRLDEAGAEDRIIQFWPEAGEQFCHTTEGDRFRLEFVDRPDQDLVRAIQASQSIGIDWFPYFLFFKRVD